MQNIYEVLNIAATEKAPTRVKLTREKLAQREYQERIAKAVRERSDVFYNTRKEGGITDQAFENVFGNRVSQLTILLMAGCFIREQIVQIMGIKEGAICNYLTQCTDRGVFYVQESRDGLLRVATEAEWEKHRIAGVSVSPAEQAKKEQAKLARREKNLAEAKERLSSVVSRLTVAEHDEDLQAQHKYLKGKVDMLEVEVLWSQQALSALPPAEETSDPAEETSDPAEETSDPAEETSDPAEETSDPAEETSDPAEADLFD
jgi:hypothetical protein